MGKILKGYIMPHPPIIVPEIGKGQEKAAGTTIESVIRVAGEISKESPTTIILSSPHAPCFSDYAYLPDSEILSGDFSSFGADIKLNFNNNTELVNRIVKKMKDSGINGGSLTSGIKRQYGISGMLDHGAMVPLYFIKKKFENFKLVCISTPFMPLYELYRLGQCISEAVYLSDENVIYVASGDLSHRLTQYAPAGFHPKGPEYDEYLIEKIHDADRIGLLNTDENFMEKAGECGTRSFVMMFGVLDDYRIKTDIYSYEGPFGVGYLVAEIKTLGRADEADVLKNYFKKKEKEIHQIRDKESDYVKLARDALENFVKTKKKLSPPQWLPDELTDRQAGVFVSLKKNGQLRGCIGTIGPTQSNIAEEIITNAISSGTADPRFEAVDQEELPLLIYSVDVLGEAEDIGSINELDVKKYGVIVNSGRRRGLLLPDLEGVDTPEQQVQIALQKAGIRKDEKYTLQRFEVIRYK